MYINALYERSDKSYTNRLQLSQHSFVINLPQLVAGSASVCAWLKNIHANIVTLRKSCIYVVANVLFNIHPLGSQIGSETTNETSCNLNHAMHILLYTYMYRREWQICDADGFCHRTRNYHHSTVTVNSIACERCLMRQQIVQAFKCNTQPKLRHMYNTVDIVRKCVSNWGKMNAVSAVNRSIRKLD